MSKPQSLSVDLPRIDGQTQSRIAINDDVVQEYADLILENNGDWPFPPIDVFHDGTDHFVADGFHRFLAAHRAKRGSIPCVLHTGSATDARIFGMTANDRHGLRMTRADKRSCVEWLLDNGGKMTQTEIAEKAGVCRRVVQCVVAERNPASIAGKATVTNRDSKAHNAPDHTTSGGKEATAKLEPDTEKADATPDYGKCPNCHGTKWTEGTDGVACAKCCHPYGEPAGDVDDDRLTTQRQKTVKTCEALMRAFDDLQCMKAMKVHDEAITSCKRLLTVAKGWK